MSDTLETNTDGNIDIPPYARQFATIRSYAELQEVMRSQDFTQDKSPMRREMFGRSMVFTDGPEHLQRKMIFANLFTKEAMSYYENQVLTPTIDQVMSELHANRAADGLARTDLIPLIRSILYRISAGVVGVDGVDTPERTERFRMLLIPLGHANDIHFTTRDPDDVMAEGKEALKIMVDEFLYPSLKRRRELVRRHKAGEIDKKALPRDALTMICLHDKDDVGEEGGNYGAYVWQECTFLVTAGTGTTTLTLPHVIVEISNWIKNHPEDADKIYDPAFLRASVGEALRLHNVAPARFRTATKDLVLSTGREVSEGETLALVGPPANREEAVFGPEPTVFNPYRKVGGGAQPWGLAFGAGAHMCCGRSLVTGLQNRTDEATGTEGTMLKILRKLYEMGLELDAANPPELSPLTYIKAYDTVPIILRKL